MRVPILMPAMSPTMEEGTISAWRVSPGDSISPGDVIAEVETDKATMEVEAVDGGVIGEILAPAGSEGVKVNSEIAFLIEDGAEGDEASPSPQAIKRAGTPTAKPEPSSIPAGDVQSNTNRTAASPLAERLAKHSGVDLGAIKGSGPNGRILKRDIEEATAGVGLPAIVTTAAPSPILTKSDQTLSVQGDYTAVPLSGMRRSIATRLRQSFNEAPHFPLSIDCNLGALLDLRTSLNADAEGAKISINDFFIRISALALRRVPAVNASFAEDSILHHKHADISVAVAIEGGLITPILRKAETKGLRQISDEMRALASRARDHQLAPEEYQGGTFSISNLGMFGVKSFSSILNPPQGAILSIGAAEERPIITDGEVKAAKILSLTLTCDHRAMDGAAGAEFLSVFKGMVEDPICMLL